MTLDTTYGIGVKKIQVIETLISEVRKAVVGDAEDEELITDDIEAFSESEASPVSSYEQSEEMVIMLDRPWDECLMLSIRTVNGLRKAQVKTLREVIIASQGSELLKLRNFGKESLNDLRRALEKLGVRHSPVQQHRSL